MEVLCLPEGRWSRPHQNLDDQVKEARDIILKVYNCLTDACTSPHQREVIYGFVKTNAEWAKRGIMLTSLKITVYPEQLTGIYGQDLEAERGSSPEILREQDEVLVDP